MAALALLAAAAASTVGDDNDTELVKQRLVAAMLPTPAGEPAAIKAAHTLAAALESNGTWPDIDYHEFRRAGWPMVAHLGRVRTMAAAWRGASNATGAFKNADSRRPDALSVAKRLSAEFLSGGGGTPGS